MPDVTTELPTPPAAKPTGDFVDVATDLLTDIDEAPIPERARLANEAAAKLDSA